MVLKKSRIKEAASADFRVSQEFIDALEAHVLELIKKAEDRAVKNKRKTLKGYDL